MTNLCIRWERIANEILMHLRKTANLKSEVSFDEPLNTDWDGNELLLSDVLGTEGDTLQLKKSQLNRFWFVVYTFFLKNQTG